MADYPEEIKNKIQKILGIPPESVQEYDASELISELCETVFMLDDQKSVPQITAMREQLTKLNRRIWALLGQNDPKKAREHFNLGISQLERYVGELKRRSGKLEDVHEQDKERLSVSKSKISLNEDRLNKLEKRVDEVQEDLQNFFHTLSDIEAMEEEAQSQ